MQSLTPQRSSRHLTAGVIPSEGNDIISVEEACGFLGIHRNTLYKLIKARELPAFRLVRGGRWKLRRNALEQWIEDKQARGLL